MVNAMRHRPECDGKPVMTRVTAVGPRQWFIFRCDQCGAVELRTQPRTPTREKA